MTLVFINYVLNIGCPDPVRIENGFFTHIYKTCRINCNNRKYFWFTFFFFFNNKNQRCNQLENEKIFNNSISFIKVGGKKNREEIELQKLN